jgi:PTS system beta-glucosides-specific IIC component
MSNQSELAGRVGELVGGPDNVSTIGSCATRLRFVVKNQSEVRFDELKATPGVIQVVNSGGQVQVVIGTHVEKVKADLLAKPEWSIFGGDTQNAGSSGQSPIDRVFDFLSGTFQPLLAPLIGAAMVKAIVTVALQFGWLTPTSPLAGMLNAAGNALFYFLPIFVGFTASRKLGANPYLGATIAAALLEPNFVGLGSPGGVVDVFGLPLYMFSYSTSMFPAIMAAFALAGTERVLKKFIPQSLQLIMVPTIALLLLVPLTAFIFGPIGVLAGNGIAAGITALSTSAPLLFYVVLSAGWILLVSFGLHWALLPIVLVDLTQNGSSTMFAAAAGYQFAMIGVALGVLLRSRQDQTVRATAGASLIASLVGGVTEPALYGLVLRFKRVLVAEVVGAAAAGLVLGLFQVSAQGLALAPLLGAPLFTPLAGYLLAFVVGVSVTTAIILWRGYEGAKSGAQVTPDTSAADTSRSSSTEGLRLTERTIITSPVAGKIISLAEVPDPIFSANILGSGIAIIPSSGRVVSPAAGTIVVAPDSAHAVGIRTDEGVELLVHVGIDTVKLAGKGFGLRVAPGDRVVMGQVLLAFDQNTIRDAGYSAVTPIVVTNSSAVGSVTPLTEGEVSEGEPLLAVEPRVATKL